MKPNYEKPIAMPLGEATKGSGQCNAGSAVIGVDSVGNDCRDGSNATSYSCAYGTGATIECVSGNHTDNTCAGGTNPFGRCGPGSSASVACFDGFWAAG